MPTPQIQPAVAAPPNLFSSIAQNIIHPINFAQNAIQGPPQAYGRVTQTPIRWTGMSPDIAGQYSPFLGSIAVNKSLYPQANPDIPNLSGVTRHEQIHDLLENTNTSKNIAQFFKNNPDYARTAQQNLQKLGKEPGDLAHEAPAYLAQREYLGLPISVMREYLARMPDDVQQKYLRLIGPQ